MLRFIIIANRFEIACALRPFSATGSRREPTHLGYAGREAAGGEKEKGVCLPFVIPGSRSGNPEPKGTQSSERLPMGSGSQLPRVRNDEC